VSAPVLPVFGDPRLPPRFWAKVRVDERTGCWIWTGVGNGAGYGQFWVGSRTDGTKHKVYAHRHAYTTLVGPIPEGLQLDHVKARGCVGPSCCNPEHLEPVTGLENRRRAACDRVACPFGHPFSGSNILWSRRGRACRECNRRRCSERSKRVVRGEPTVLSDVAKTHCPKGHPYDEANTYRYLGWRFCRSCRNARSRARRQKGDT
jgi:hypothetical protein